MKTYTILFISLVSVTVTLSAEFDESLCIERTLQEELEELNRGFDVDSEINEMDLYDEFDKLADDDQIENAEYQMTPCPIPSWLRTIGVAVFLRLIQLQQYASDSLVTIKQLLGFGKSIS